MSRFTAVGQGFMTLTGRSTLFNATFVIAVSGFVLTGSQANGRGVYALYQSDGAFHGSCLPRAGSPAAILRRNGIQTQGNASEAERAALARGFAQIERLRGGQPIPANWRTRYNFINSRSGSGRYTWNQGAHAINVRRPRGDVRGQNVTRLMHEFGHKVGNSGQYSRYSSFIGRQKCRITPYCTHGGRNEEFAEAFAAYITMPDRLRRDCPRAYAFFSTRLFPGSSQVATCGNRSVIGELRRTGSGERRRPSNHGYFQHQEGGR